MTDSSFNPDDLDPGVRDLVVWLRDLGFDTTDSGDGSKVDTMECAVPFPMVAIRVRRDEQPQVRANYLYEMLRRAGVEFDLDGVGVELSYDPHDQIAVLVVRGVMSADVDMRRDAKGKPL